MRAADWESMPTWPFYTVLYVLAAFIVTESLKVENRRACAAGSPMSTRQQILLGAGWPATAILMVVARRDPFACFSKRDPPEKTEW